MNYSADRQNDTSHALWIPYTLSARCHHLQPSAAICSHSRIKKIIFDFPNLVLETANAIEEPRRRQKSASSAHPRLMNLFAAPRCAWTKAGYRAKVFVPGLRTIQLCKIPETNRRGCGCI
jgi:hypothetical protein